VASRDRYLTILRGFRRARIVVVGDLIADEFISGHVTRVSREAPVLILQYDATDVVPGGAGNAASNVAALGAHVEVVAVVGRDHAGRRLLAAMPPSAGTRHVVRAGRHVTPVKTRIIAGGVHSAKQQVVRIDRTSSAATPAVRRQVEAALTLALRHADAVIVSDYGSGLVTPELLRRAMPRRTSGRAPGAPLVLVDSRHGVTGFTGVTACTPNESEVEAQLGLAIGDDPAALERAGRELLKRMESRAVLVTRGSRGMALFEPGKRTDHIPIVGSDEIADVTGAGDTVIATFTLALASGASFADAARLANYAGALVVMKRGTATVSATELAAAIQADTRVKRR
jgi:rfaE bifunctional protein kinase chain/domain